MARKFLCALALLLLAACGVLTPDDQRTLESMVSDARAGRTEPIYERLAPSLKTPEAHAALGQLTTMLQNAGEPCERTFVHSSAFNQINTGAGSGRRVSAIHTYACPNATLRVEQQLWIETDSSYVIEKFYITPIDATAAAQAETFSLEGKSTLHYAFFAMAIGSPILMITALLGVIFTKGFKRKWLWAIVSFVGITKLSMIWPTGQLVTEFVTINLIGFGVMRSMDPLAPWIVSFTPPVGALLVLSLLWPRWAGLSKGEELAGPG